MLYEVYQLCAGSERMSNEQVVAAGKLVGTLLWERLGDGTYFAGLTGPDGRYLVECLDNARRFDRSDGLVKIKGIQRHGRPKARYSHSDYQAWLCRPVPKEKIPPAVRPGEVLKLSKR